ncbi:hypothetical protein DID88_005642 [Monilinia fructigena]|uniref:Uncharacterized protein n=1 Tax=Monilinia fructigena TaxID=38457 RepID=A0A395J0R1_9HELO|nr:hypothetical protein DID88_005642 [Monilinia fructigena]
MAAPSPDDKESPTWAMGFEAPIGFNEDRKWKEKKEEEEEEKGREEEEKAGSETTKPQGKADTIRGTPTVDQTGPNLAEGTKKEMTEEFFGEMEDAENAMARGLEAGKYTQQVGEIKGLMARSIQKMNITMEGEEEATEDQLKLQVLRLRRKLDEKGLKDDQTTAQMIALEGQIKQAEVRPRKKDEKQKAKGEDEWKKINKEIQDCQREGREKDRQINELTTSLKDAENKLEFEKAGYHEYEVAKDEIKSLKEQVQKLNEELLAVEEQNRKLMDDLDGVEKDLESANKNENLIAELSLKLRAYENEDKAYLVRIGNLERECKQLALQLVMHKREIKAKNKTIEENTEALKEARDRISQLEAVARFGKHPSASEAVLFASGQEIKRLEEQLSSVRQLKSDEEEKAMRERRRLEQRIEEALSEIHRLEQIEKPSFKPDLVELADLRWRVQNCDGEKEKLRERIRYLEKEVEGDHKLINKITVEHHDLLSVNKSLEKKLSKSVKFVKELQRSLGKEKEKAKAEAGVGGDTQDEQALEKEKETLQKEADESGSGVEERAWELTALKAHSSLYVVEILLGFLVLRRALDGVVSGDMEDVKAVMTIVLDESEEAGDAELVAEVAWLKAIVCYYEGDTPKALIGFTQALEADVWEYYEKNILEQWIRECTPGTSSDCPTGRSGYREALGFGPGPGTLKAPLKRPSDKQLKEAKKVKKEAKNAAKRAKKPRRAPEPRRRGVHRRDLYVGILSPRQQRIWDSIDFNNFDYNQLNSGQQSLFSFEPFEDEPHSLFGGVPPPQPPQLPPRESPPQPPQPPPESPPDSPRRDERVRTPSSTASSAASIIAEGNQIRRPSRMDDLTTNASLHIQWLTARLADREARIRELENIHGDILIVRAQLHRREGQIQELRNHANIMIAELTVWRRTAREERRRLREERNRGWWAWMPV